MRSGWLGLVVSFIAAFAWPTSGASADATPLEGTAWILTSLAGRIPPTKTTATARFADSRVQGTNGCNRYSAPVVIQGATMKVSRNAATTNMACPPEIMKFADAFMSALFSASSYRISDHRLEMLGGAGRVLATFSAQSQSLAGTSWRVTDINNGKEAVVSLVPGSRVTMDFATDGKVSGTAGCNNYTSTYKQKGERLTFAPAIVTRRICAGAAVMQQEQAFLRALGSAATAGVEGERLELRTAEGALALSLVRNPSP